MIEKAKEDYFDGNGRCFGLQDIGEKLNQVIDLLNKNMGDHFEEIPTCGCSPPSVDNFGCECRYQPKGSSSCPHCPAQKKIKEKKEDWNFTDKVKSGLCTETNVFQWTRELKQNILEDLDSTYIEPMGRIELNIAKSVFRDIINKRLGI